eukprot:2888510-Pyramimonas_sp.AAC.1
MLRGDAAPERAAGGGFRGYDPSGEYGVAAAAAPPPKTHSVNGDAAKLKPVTFRVASAATAAAVTTSKRPAGAPFTAYTVVGSHGTATGTSSMAKGSAAPTPVLPFTTTRGVSASLKRRITPASLVGACSLRCLCAARYCSGPSEKPNTFTSSTSAPAASPSRSGPLIPSEELCRGTRSTATRATPSPPRDTNTWCHISLSEALRQKSVAPARRAQYTPLAVFATAKLSTESTLPAAAPASV